MSQPRWLTGHPLTLADLAQRSSRCAAESCPPRKRGRQSLTQRTTPLAGALLWWRCAVWFEESFARTRRSRGRNRGWVVHRAGSATRALLGSFLLRAALLRGLLLCGSFLCRFLRSFFLGLGLGLRRFLDSLSLCGSFLGSFLGRLLCNPLHRSFPGRWWRGWRASLGHDLRLAFFYFFHHYDSGFRLLFFFLFLFVFLVLERIAIGTVSVVIHLVVVTTVERFIECHIHVLLMLPDSAQGNG